MGVHLRSPLDRSPPMPKAMSNVGGLVTRLCPMRRMLMTLQVALNHDVAAKIMQPRLLLWPRLAHLGLRRMLHEAQPTPKIFSSRAPHP